MRKEPEIILIIYGILTVIFLCSTYPLWWIYKHAEKIIKKYDKRNTVNNVYWDYYSVSTQNQTNNQNNNLNFYF